MSETKDTGMIREFATGATRDTAANKPDYFGFLSPLVLKRFGEYMNKHRVQADGSLRASDNWQKGIPPEVYMSSKLRHDLDVWLIMRGYPEAAVEPNLEEALCAVLFNVQGLLFEVLKAKYRDPKKVPTAQAQSAKGPVMQSWTRIVGGEFPSLP